MSPEQAPGEEVDARSDIYSLGCAVSDARRCAAVRRPSPLSRSLMKQPPPPRADPAAPARDPPTLAAIVDRTLAKDPAERFQTAEQLSQALVEPSRLRRRTACGCALTVLSGAPPKPSWASEWWGAWCSGARRPVETSPHLGARPIPDSLAQPLRRQGALAAGDAALYVFSPAARDDFHALLVARPERGGGDATRVRAYRRIPSRCAMGLCCRAGSPSGWSSHCRARAATPCFATFSSAMLRAVTPLSKLIAED